MGKVRKYRQKYHLSLEKSKSLNNLHEVGEQKNEVDLKKNSFVGSSENIFPATDISWMDYNKSLPQDFDVRSVFSNKSRKELKEDEKHLKKKDRIKLRHERFLHKLDLTHKLIKNSKLKKKTKKKSCGANMSSLLEVLQSLEDDEPKGKQEKSKIKAKGILKAKQRLKQQAFDTKLFKHILDDKIFKENPLQAVNQYLKQKVAMDS